MFAGLKNQAGKSERRPAQPMQRGGKMIGQRIGRDDRLETQYIDIGREIADREDTSGDERGLMKYDLFRNRVLCSRLFSISTDRCSQHRTAAKRSGHANRCRRKDFQNAGNSDRHILHQVGHEQCIGRDLDTRHTPSNPRDPYEGADEHRPV